MLVIQEDSTTVKSSNPYGSSLDAAARDSAARIALKDVFDTDAHVDRIVAVGDIIKLFFNRYPDYHTARFGRGKPFENVKISDVGSMLNRIPAKVKLDQLYSPLNALGNVDVISKNGHLIVRVYV